MPVSQQMVVACDRRDCPQTVGVNSNMTNDALDDAIKTLLAERGWVTYSNGDTYYYCQTHGAELRLFFPEGVV